MSSTIVGFSPPKKLPKLIHSSSILNQVQSEMPEASLIPDSAATEDVEAGSGNVPVSAELQEASDEEGDQRSDFKAEVEVAWDFLKITVGGIISVFAGNGKAALAGHKLLFNAFILSACVSLFLCALVILIGNLRPPRTRSMVWLVRRILRVSVVFFIIFVTSVVAILLHISGIFLVFASLIPVLLLLGIVLFLFFLLRDRVPIQ